MRFRHPASTVHLTQLRHPKFNPGGLEKSQNCGPATLAMALCHLGLWPAGVDPQEQIDAARTAMFSDQQGRSLDRERDGWDLDEAGNRVRSLPKHQTLTDLVDLERGARNCGALTRRLRTLTEVATQARLGRPTILAGDPSRPGAYGPRIGVGYLGGHFILVTGRFRQFYRVHDPLCLLGPVDLLESELEAFLSARLYPEVGLLLLGRKACAPRPKPA